MVNLNTYNRVRYKILHNGYEFPVSESVNWRSERTNYKRHDYYNGIFSEITDSVELSREGAKYLRDIYKEGGGNAKAKLIKEVRHYLTDVWEETINADIDFLHYSDDGIKVSVKLNTKGFETVLKARSSEKIEIERLDDLQGDEIEELDTDTLALEGRDILLISQSKLSTPIKTDIIKGISEPDAIFAKELWFTPVMEMVNKSDNSFFAVMDGYLGYKKNDDSLHYHTNAGHVFYYNANHDKTINLQIKINNEVKVMYGNEQFYVDVVVSLIKFSNTDDFSNPTHIPLHTQEIRLGNRSQIQADINIDVDLLENQSLALVYNLHYRSFTTGDYYVIDYIDLSFEMFGTLNMIVTEESYYEPSTTKMILSEDLGKRIVSILDKNVGFKYHLPLESIGFVSGHWYRKFDNVNNLYKPFTTTWKDYFETLNILYGGVGIDITHEGLKEVLNIRTLDYYYNRNNVIDLGEVAKATQIVDIEKYYSSIEIGYNEPKKEYEEAMGLDEYNKKTRYITPIDRHKKELKLIIPYRADSYGAEFLRREPVSKEPTKDKQGDKHIFIEEIKKGSGKNYEQRKWQDDFDEQPINVFSPNTATRLNITPARLLLINKTIKAPLLWNLDDNIKYTSSEGNSNLFINNLQENSDIKIKNLKKAIYLPMILELEKTLTYEVKEKIKGITNGIQNIYGLFSYKHKGIIKQGFLLEIIDDNKIKLIESE